MNHPLNKALMDRRQDNCARVQFIHEESDRSMYDLILDLWQQSQEVYVASAFVSIGLLNIIAAHLRDSITHAEIRFLTGTMNGFNEPRVLEKLCDFFGRENVRLYKPVDADLFDASNFHVKSYLFKKIDGNWTVIIGSSNFTLSALLGWKRDAVQGNAEWNLLLGSGSPENDRTISEINARYMHYWSSASIALNDSLLADYRNRWLTQHQALTLPHSSELGKDKSAPPTPRPVQLQALETLRDLRQMQLNRAAVIGATGVGKTMIAAFDVQESRAHSVLFVAHRAIILNQALEGFRHLLGAEYDYYRIGSDSNAQSIDTISRALHGSSRPFIVFAMIQTLRNPDNYNKFEPTLFDYVVIDEFHHASAKSYNVVTDYFSPSFLLGLTATPERMDGRDVLQLCDFNIALEVRLFDAIDNQCLSPFLYFAVFDETDYEKVRWTGVGYDEVELEEALSQDSRATLIAKTLDDHLPSFGKVKAIAFCSNVGHARFMASALEKQGYSSACIIGETPETERQNILHMLCNEMDPLNIVCTVDVLSEGIDVPALTHILLLRPTQSFTVFLQQIGRGLRTHPQKDFLVILDFIGNYRNNYVAPLALSGRFSGDSYLEFGDTVEFKTPKGCYIHPDTKVKKIWQESIRSKFAYLNTKDRLKQLYVEIWEDLGRERSPLIMDFIGHPLCNDPMKFIRSNAFGNWLRVKEECGGLDDNERSWLDTPAEDFLMHLERELHPTKSYKMAVLSYLLTTDVRCTSWDVEEIAKGFRSYYAGNPLHLKDYDDMSRSGNPDEYPLVKVIAHLKKNPLYYLSDKPEKFFVLENDHFSIKDSLIPYWSQLVFRESLGDRINFALNRYWERKHKETQKRQAARNTP